MSIPTFVRAGRWWLEAIVVLVFLGGGVGCGSEVPSPSHETVARAVNRLTTPSELRLALPSGTKLHDLGVVGSSSLHLGPRASVVASAPSVFVTLASSGQGGTTLGPEAALGNLVSVGAVELGPRARINGFVKTASTVQQGPNAVIGGAVETEATLSPLQPFAWTVDFEASAVDRTFASKADAVLPPGAYRNVVVQPHATLRLAGGTYFMDSLDVKPNARVIADTTGESPVLVYVASTFEVASAMAAAGPAARLFVGYLGRKDTRIRASFRGTIVAPHAALRLGAGTDPIQGTFFAEHVRLDPGVAIVFEPFAAWDFIFPPRPILDCVVHFDGTHSTSLWGYDNPLDVTVTIPVGARNQLAPSDTRLTTRFEPGRQTKVFFAFFGTPESTWSLGGGSVVADNANSRRCLPEDLPLPIPGPSDELPRSEGASRPQTQRAALLRDVRSGILKGVLPGRTPPRPAPSTTFRFLIDGQDLPNADAACGPRQLSVNTRVNGITELRDLPGCTNPGACGVPIVDETYEREIPAGQAQVAISVDVFERDTPLCGGDDDHILTLELVADAESGAILGGSLITFRSDGSPNQSQFLDPSTRHVTGLDGFGIYYRAEASPPPRICGTWKGQYIDSGPSAGMSEDFATGTEPEDIAASFSLAQLQVRAGATTVFDWIGVLDEDGCVPRAEGPPAALLRASPTAFIALRLQSEACFDPTGAGCAPLNDPLRPNQTSGARMRITSTSDDGVAFLENANRVPRIQCTVFTSSDVPDCEVIRDFPGWMGTRAPATLRFTNTSVFDVTRLMGTVSHMLRTEALAARGTGSDLGLTRALIDRTGVTSAGATPGLIEIAANTVVCVEPPCTDGPLACLARGACDTAASDPIAIAPDRTVDGRFIPGDASWKFVTAHEIGHKVQQRAMGTLRSRYREPLPGFVRQEDIPAKCSCDHVSSSNTLHCLQSAEEPNAAQIEGWAQFYASRVWNRAEEPDCVFKYYKEFLNDGCMPGVPVEECAPVFRGDSVVPIGIRSRPPVAVSCVEPVRWRNNRCLDATVAAAEAVTELGVEYDWMGFLYSINTQGAERASLNDLFGIYTTACGGPCGREAANDPRLTWDGCTRTGCAPGVGGLRDAAQQFLGAGRQATVDRFSRDADLYGVNRSVRR